MLLKHMNWGGGPLQSPSFHAYKFTKALLGALGLLLLCGVGAFAGISPSAATGATTGSAAGLLSGYAAKLEGSLAAEPPDVEAKAPEKGKRDETLSPAQRNATRKYIQIELKGLFQNLLIVKALEHAESSVKRYDDARESKKAKNF